ncbi:MAG: HemK family protein methyltransferase, partial [Proteobacteria bacterium]|nr:HemK family protein methyltransferase [Pseudomonadota bacterium]
MEVLLTAALGVQRAYLYAHGDEPLTIPGAAQLERMLADYHRGTPVAYLIGRREFWKLSLEVSRDVLIPRRETELLVELVLLRLRPRARVLDLGTGSGAIALAIKQERSDCAVTATDISTAAIETARRNASTYGLDLIFRVGSWYSVAE